RAEEVRPLDEMERYYIYAWYIRFMRPDASDAQVEKAIKRNRTRYAAHFSFRPLVLAHALKVRDDWRAERAKWSTETATEVK
ncbi:MAG TPA: hypothetical protein VMT32_07860, partial [Bryobacteraceae bacterium]|nr:hypothetical protein [Bryobacteraceae bacterium]